jgi:hypothetical protein
MMPGGMTGPALLTDRTAGPRNREVTGAPRSPSGNRARTQPRPASVKITACAVQLNTAQSRGDG